MRRYRYIKKLLFCWLVLWGYVLPLFAQTIPSAGGSLNSGTYILIDNTTIKGALIIDKGNNVTVDLNGYVLQGNMTNGGFVFEVKEGATLTIKDSQPNVGHAGHLDEKGRFVWGTTGQTMGVNGGIIYNLQKEGKSTQGISVSGTCIIERAKIMGCHSEHIGAAVVVTSSGSFTMKAGEIRYNYSASKASGTRVEGESAGVIYGEPSHGNQGSIIKISKTVISDNNTLGNGGAICGYNVTLTDCTLGNNTTTRNGGAVYVRRTDDSSKGASLTITSSTFSNNSAVHGGAIFAEEGASVAIKEGSVFSSNKATNNGGGIYVYDLEIKGTAAQKVLFKKNTAVTGGGLCVLYAEDDKCNIEYCEINDNYATTNGGGIFARTNTTIKNSWIQRNRAMKTEPQEWILDDDGDRKLVNSGRGGGFYFQGISETDKDVINPTFNLENTLVTYNASMYYGGGGQVCTGATLNLNSGSQIDNNVAVLHGAGGLHVTGTATVNINDGSSISGNTASTVGGAIHSSYGCTLNFNGGIIQNNIAHQRGGGVHINTGGEMLLQGTQIINNKVTRGPDMQYSEVTESDGIYSWTEPVAENEKSNYKLDEDGNVEYSGYGGGVLIDSGTLTMNGGSISDNSAEIGGGGVALVMIRIGDMEGNSDSPEDRLRSVLKDSRFYNYKVVQFTLNDGHILYNKTTKTSSVDEETRLGYEIGNGAGVYIMENALKSKLGGALLTEAQWQEYAEGKGTYQKYKEIYEGISGANVTGGSMTGNEASGRGGALFLQQGIVDMDNLTMNQNTAVGDGGGLYLHDGTLTIGSDGENQVMNNEAKNGGGICIANGTLSIGYCDIKNNQATNFGGGLYVANTEEVKITLDGGGVFNNNTAVAGGGMAVGGPITLNFQGSLQSNTADNGGGIYLLPKQDSRNGATLVFKGGFIRDNSANGSRDVGTGYFGDVSSILGFGGGIFLSTGTTFTTSLDEGATLGFYNNKAKTGGDDIFANGNGTTVNLPSVSTMYLTDWDVPTTQIYWVEDYVLNDTKYREFGSNMIGDVKDEVRRYQDALNQSLPIYKVVDEYFEGVKNKYLCLSLGYKILYMTIKKMGLQEGESAIFNIYDTANKLYRTVLLTGRGNQTIQKVAVPEGAWRVEEDDGWTWNYKQSIVSPENGIIEIKDVKTDVENTITFTNELKDTDKKMYDETIKVNVMGTSSSSFSNVE